MRYKDFERRARWGWDENMDDAFSVNIESADRLEGRSRNRVEAMVLGF